MGGEVKKYQIIYADPPWKYGGGKGKNSKKWGNSQSAYPCMKLEDIKKLPIAKIADTNSSLFLWGSFPNLKQTLEVMESWGFEYKTGAFVWNKVYNSGKQYCGMGYWTRSGTEFCLLGFRGKMRRQSTKVYQVINALVTKHSEKPKETKKRIVELMGDLHRIELFAREKVEGWDSWGNEIVSDIDLT